MKPRGKPFEKGHKSKGGRPLGAKNFTSIDIRQKMFEAVCLVARGEISEEAFLAALIKLAKRGPEGGLMWAMVQQLTPVPTVNPKQADGHLRIG